MASSTTTGSFSTAPHAQDGHLRLVDDGRRENAAEAAEIGDGERSALHFVGLELARAGARGQVHDGALQADHVLLVGIADHRDDQPVLERHRDPDIRFRCDK